MHVLVGDSGLDSVSNRTENDEDGSESLGKELETSDFLLF